MGKKMASGLFLDNPLNCVFHGHLLKHGHVLPLRLAEQNGADTASICDEMEGKHNKKTTERVEVENGRGAWVVGRLMKWKK